VSYSPGRKHLAMGLQNGIIRILEDKSGEGEFEEVAILTGHANSVYSDDKTVKLWETQTFKEVATLTGHAECVCRRNLETQLASDTVTHA